MRKIKTYRYEDWWFGLSLDWNSPDEIVDVNVESIHEVSNDHLKFSEFVANYFPSNLVEKLDIDQTMLIFDFQ